jgi:predicted MFS family arabinose efflux permease
MAFAFAGTLYHDEARRRAITRIYAAASGAEIIVFPIITRVADLSSWRWAFATLAAGGATLVVLALLALPRDPAPPVRPQRLRALPGVYAVLVRDHAMRLLYGAQFLRGVAWTGTLAYMGAFIDDELGYSVRAAGFALTVVGSGFLAGSLLVGGRLRRREPRLTFITATALMGALIGVMFLWRPGIGITYGLLLLIAFCGGVAEVTAITLISAETPAAQAPTMALHSSILRYGTSSGALAGGVLLALGGYRLLGGGLLLSAAAGAWTCTRSRRRWRAGDQITAPGGA